MEEGVEPTDQKIAWLGNEITKLAEILVEYHHDFELKRRARAGLIRKLKALAERRKREENKEISSRFQPANQTIVNPLDLEPAHPRVPTLPGRSSRPQKS